MPKRISFHVPDVLEKGGLGSEIVVHLLAEIIIIVTVYFITRPRGNNQSIPYPSLIQQTYANNQLTQALQYLTK